MDANEKHTDDGSCTGGKSVTIDVPKAPSIEDFVVLKPISRGAFGKVYLARKKCNGRLYAVKVMKKAYMVDKNMTDQMKAERDALALSKSPFVVHLYYSLQTVTKIYLVMEYLIGGDVKSLLHIYGYFDQDMAVKYISEVALALDYLHRHGIIHRDLKPDNMLVSNEGHIKLTDFGLSKVKLDRELSLADILTTPSLAKQKQDYFRTPGQLLSLISSLGFNASETESKRHCSSSAVLTPMSCGKVEWKKVSLCSPLKKMELFSPACSSRIRGPNSCVFSPYTLAKNLTPCLLKSRKRFDTLSAASSRFQSVSDNDGDVSPLWETEQKENEGICEKKTSEQALSSEAKGGTARMPGWGCALMSLDNFVPPAAASRGRFEATSGEMQKATKPDTLAGKRLQFNKEGASASTKDGVFPPATDGSWSATASSAKRTFSDVDHSPEMLEIQAKKSNAEYNRCFEIPEGSARHHTGLTGLFTTINVDDFRPSTEGSGLAEGGQVPRPSSPSAVTKNLLCELEEPAEDVFLDGVRELANSRFASGEEDRKLTRSLSFDSGGSVHEMSIGANSPTSRRPSRRSTGNSTSSDEMTEHRNPPGPLPRTPAGVVETPKLGAAFQRGESKTSFRNRLPELACSVTKSPPFVKPRNVVAFRSYCSAIDRSNVSWNSHWSLGSVEPMDMSTSASYHRLPTAMTPVQKTPSANSSLFQTPRAMTTPHNATPFRTPKSVRRGAVPVEGAPIQGTPDYLAPELLLGSSHDFRVDWWALGVCLFEFLTGVPPFNDETPQLVFQNILNRDIPWPGGEEELSDNSRNAIESLLTMDMTKRAGLNELKRHPLFEGLDWDNLQDQTMPFIPQPEDETDTSYFDARNNAQQLAVSDFSL